MKTIVVVALLIVALLVPCAAAAQEAASAPRVTAAQIRRALRRYRREPSIQRVVRAALAHRTATPARVHDAMDRARLAGLLPRLDGSLRRGQAVDLRGLTGVPGTDVNVSTDDDLVVQGGVTFDLDRLIFAPQESSLLRELRATEQQQADVARAVVHLYFERRRLQLERDLLGQTDLPRALRILEAEALLDAFTGGAFTRMMGAPEEGPEAAP